MTYCNNRKCPFTDCKYHILNCRSIGKVRVANLDSICRRYITWVLKEVENDK